METTIAQPGQASAGGSGAPAPASGRQVRVALRRFLRGCQHALLYDADHSEFGAALTLAFEGCQELLAIFPTCTLHLDPSGLCLMGEPCPPDTSLARFCERLQERGLTALTFSVGVTQDEVLSLVALLKMDPDLLAEQGGPAAWLLQSGATHLSLNRPRLSPSYQAAWECFLASQEGADRAPLRHLLAACPEVCRGPRPADASDDAMLAWLAESLSETAAAVPLDAPERPEWLDHLAAQVQALTAELKGRLFRLPMPPGPDVLAEVAARLAPEEAAQILVSYPNAVVGEPSQQLQAVLRRLMPEETRTRAVEPLAKAALLARGMTEESYLSVVSLVLKKRPASAPGPLEPLPRRTGVQRVSLLTDLLASSTPWALQQSHVDMLLELVVAPEDLAGRAQLVRSLAELIPLSLAERPDDGAVQLLRRVEEAIGCEVVSPPEKRLLRAALTRACTPEACRRLARFLLRESSRDNLFLLSLISQADAGFDPLLQIARETLLPRLQAAVGSALLRMGERSAQACYQKLSSGTPQEALALARALVLSGAQEGLARGLWALQHPAPAVAAGLMEALAHHRDASAARILLGGLSHPAPEVQRAAALSLGHHPSAEVVAALSALLNNAFGTRRPGVVQAAVTALGRLGRPDCVPPLRALLGRRPLLFRQPSRELWALATQALATLPGAEAEQALQKGAHDGPPELAALCAQALQLRRLTPPSEGAHDATG